MCSLSTTLDGFPGEGSVLVTGTPAEPPYSPAQARKMFYENVRATFPDPVLERYLARAERESDELVTAPDAATPGREPSP